MLVSSISAEHKPSQGDEPCKVMQFIGVTSRCEKVLTMRCSADAEDEALLTCSMALQMTRHLEVEEAVVERWHALAGCGSRHGVFHRSER